MLIKKRFKRLHTDKHSFNLKTDFWAMPKIRTYRTYNLFLLHLFSLCLSLLSNYRIMLFSLLISTILQPKLSGKCLRVRERKHQASKTVNMGLKMFCKDLARLFLFIITLCFFGGPVFVTGCDDKQADLWYYWDFAFTNHSIYPVLALNSLTVGRITCRFFVCNLYVCVFFRFVSHKFQNW